MPAYEPPPEPGADSPEAPGARERRAALRQRYRVDMVRFRPGVHDVRVEHGGWVYYVRAVRWGEPLAGLARYPTPNPGALAMIGLVRLLWTGLVRLLPRRTWRVGVVRGPDPASWKTGEPVVVHREVLEAGEHPARRVAELAAEARDGRWERGEE